MTKEEFYVKRLELLMQSIDAEQAIIQCAERHGTWKMGLDSNRASFKTLEETYRGKIAELERQARIEGILPESEKSNETSAVIRRRIRKPIESEIWHRSCGRLSI